MVGERLKGAWPINEEEVREVAEQPGHTHIVVRHDGEPAEDVVESEDLDGDHLDATMVASFPASDAPSTWAGPDRLSRRSRRSR